MRHTTILHRLTAAVLLLAITLTACAAGPAAPSASSQPAGTPAADATVGELADYFLGAADDYHPQAQRSALVEGLDESAPATRLQMFVLAGRAFGPLPAPQGQTTPPAADLADVPTWAQTELRALSDGGVLAPADLQQPEQMEESVTLKDAQALARRFFARLGTNLKDDFYAAVNHRELNTLEIPEGELTAGGSSAVTANTNRQLHQLILEIVNSGEAYPAGSPQQKIRDLYNNVLQVEARERAGIEPLRKYLDAADAARNFSELNAAIALAVNELGNGGNGLFPAVAVTDTQDSSRKVLQLMTLFPALPQEDYDIPESEALKDYRATLVQQLLAVGESQADAERHADGLLRMEKALAENSQSAQEAGDLQKKSKRYTPRTLDEMMPQAKPSELFAAIGVPIEAPMQVFDDGQFAVYATWFTEENLELFKAMQKTALLVGYSQYLSTQLAETYGYQTSSPEETANSAVQNFLSEELGQIYVSRYFPPQAKAGVEEMVRMMIEAFKTRIGRLDWMEEATKQEALKKLDSITVLIGYPDEWDLNPAQIKPAAEGGSYFANAAASEVEKWKKMIGTLEEPVDARRFPMAAFTVNAAASRNTNTLIFPAGILQAPFYDAAASFETNLGAIGSTIAHEITHMFDDGGAQYDAQGNVRNWWAQSDYAHFQQLCQRVEAFYEGYEAAPGIPTDGKETLSENISDIGGIACGLEVLSTMENPDYDAFFRSFARQWLRVASYETLAELASTDLHAPNNLRCNRVLANFQEFFDTYGIGPGDGMYVPPEERVAVW